MSKSGKKTQQTIDFGTRGQRLRLLDRIKLPDDIPRTSPAAMLSVLRCLDSHARDKGSCRVTAGRMAEETGYSRRSVDRALIALEAMYLISRKRTGGSSIYEICWGNLQELLPAEDGLPMDASSGPKRPENRPAESRHDVQSEWTSCPVRVDMVSTPSGHGVHSTETYLETPLETPPPPPWRPDPTGREPTWRDAEAAVAACGVGRSREAIDQARSAGVGAAYVLACVAIFREALAAQLWRPGALHDRLCQASPHVPPNEGWPPQRPATPREERALGLLEAIRAHLPNVDQGQLLAMFEQVARTDPERAPPEQADIARRHGCPYSDQEIARVFYEAVTRLIG